MSLEGVFGQNALADGAQKADDLLPDLRETCRGWHHDTAGAAIGVPAAGELRHLVERSCQRVWHLGGPVRAAALEALRDGLP